jgi:hypothetical protein
VNLRYHLGNVDPFGPQVQMRRPQKTSRGGATDSQVAALVNLGVGQDTALRFTKKQAGAVITKLRQERCTIKQARVLKNFGFDPLNYNVESAKKELDRLLGGAA